MKRHGSTRAALALWLLWLAPHAAALGGEYYLSDARLGERTAPLLLLSRPDIQADLGLTTEQIASAEATIDELYTRAEALRGQDNSPQVVAERKAIDTAQTHWITTRLSSSQQDRLMQLDLQWEGPAALVSRRVVAETLELTPEQFRVLSQAAARHRAALRDGQTAGAAERAFAKTTLANLTADQQERWKVMLGKPLALKTAAKPAAPAAVRR
jgi:hypothetical protein